MTATFPLVRRLLETELADAKTAAKTADHSIGPAGSCRPCAQISEARELLGWLADVEAGIARHFVAWSAARTGVTS